MGRSVETSEDIYDAMQTKWAAVGLIDGLILSILQQMWALGMYNSAITIEVDIELPVCNCKDCLAHTVSMSLSWAWLVHVHRFVDLNGVSLDPDQACDHCDHISWGDFDCLDIYGVLILWTSVSYFCSLALTLV